MLAAQRQSPATLVTTQHTQQLRASTCTSHIAAVDGKPSRRAHTQTTNRAIRSRELQTYPASRTANLQKCLLIMLISRKIKLTIGTSTPQGDRTPRNVFGVAALLTVVGATAGDQCAPLSLEASHWQGQVAATIDGRLKLAFSGDQKFTTTFAEPQDLTAHALLSFNLFKVREPVSLFLSVITPYGEHFTESVGLFEQKNTITVDLSTNEFSVDRVNFNQPIVGLSAVSAIRIYLVSSTLAASGEAVLDSVVVCASDDAAENLALAEIVGASPANANGGAAELTQAAFPDVESLSQALTGALAEVQRLSADVAELRTTQHRVARAFEQFSLRARTSLDTAVDALSGAMSSNVEQALANAKLLERVRTSLADTSAKQSARVEQLERQFAALHSLGSVQAGESLAAAVARTVHDESARDDARHAEHARKRTVDADAARAAVDAARAAKPVVSSETPDRFHIARARLAKRSTPTPFVRAP